jgi:hypothetical protein
MKKRMKGIHIYRTKKEYFKINKSAQAETSPREASWNPSVHGDKVKEGDVNLIAATKTKANSLIKPQ